MEVRNSVGLLGYGRFGQAFAGLCQAANFPVRVFDPGGQVPAELRAGSLVELTRHSELLVVAVPMDAMEGAFQALAPNLNPNQVVLDVGSVKVMPSAAMSSTFGTRQPWVATHPLFGPASLARGERPLQVVICPNPMHPAAVARVEQFFRALGCEPSPCTPEEHDREMALTHALAFYVAKGMLDIGVPAHPLHAPPSFQGMARSIQAVRVDAGHLLPALHRFNPFAAVARRDLLKALTAIDNTLLHSVTIAPAQTDNLFIPDLGDQSPELRETRELIDEVDDEILALLARRAVLAARLALTLTSRSAKLPQRNP